MPHQFAYMHSTTLRSSPGILRSLYLHIGWKPYTKSCMAKRKVELILGTRTAVSSDHKNFYETTYSRKKFKTYN